MQALICMRIRRIILSLLLALLAATALAACGSAKQKDVPAGDIAIVGDQPVTVAQFDFLITQVKAQYAATKNTATPKTFPAVGSKDYQTLKDQAVASLVEQAAVIHQATKMGVKVTDAEVTTSLKQSIAQNFNGSQKKYQAELNKLHLTEPQVKEQIRNNLIKNKVQSALFASVTISSSAINDYYNAHKSSYQKGVSRSVSHILLKTKAKADLVYQQLKAGANFAKLAKKYSIDTQTKNVGGKLGSLEKTTTLAKPFAKVLFSDLKTGTFSKPVRTIYGWHIIMPTGPIVKPHLSSLKEATASIRQALLAPKQTEATTNWVAKAEKFAAGNTSYAASYKPTTMTSSSTVGTTTTG